MGSQIAVAPKGSPNAPPAPNPIMSFVPMIVVIGILYFLIIRPQQQQAKEHRRLVDNLKTGDRVITQGGVHGTVTGIKGGDRSGQDRRQCPRRREPDGHRPGHTAFDQRERFPRLRRKISMNRTRIVLWTTLALVGLSAYFLIPTLKWYRMTAEERTEREQDRDPILKKTLNLGLDLRGGTHLVLELDRSKLPPETKTIDALDRAIEIIRNRVDQFGVAEPLIARQGDRWIVVQLPGIKDSGRAKELIGKTALLEFRLVDDSGIITSLSKALLDKKMSMDQYYDAAESGPAAEGSGQDRSVRLGSPAGTQGHRTRGRAVPGGEVDAGIDRCDARGRQSDVRRRLQSDDVRVPQRVHRI